MIDVVKPTPGAMDELKEKYFCAAAMHVHLLLERPWELHQLQYREALTDKDVELDKNWGRD